MSCNFSFLPTSEEDRLAYNSIQLESPFLEMYDPKVKPPLRITRSSVFPGPTQTHKKMPNRKNKNTFSCYVFPLFWIFQARCGRQPRKRTVNSPPPGLHRFYFFFMFFFKRTRLHRDSIRRHWEKKKRSVISSRPRRKERLARNRKFNSVRLCKLHVTFFWGGFCLIITQTKDIHPSQGPLMHLSGRDNKRPILHPMG